MEKPSRSFFRLLTYSFTAALLTGLAFALLVAGATWAFAGSSSFDLALPQVNSVSPDQVVSGMITDSRCCARHSRDSAKDPAECIRSCVRHGAKYMLVDGEANYVLAGSPAVLDRLAGQRARIQGALNGASLRVTASRRTVDSGRPAAPRALSLPYSAGCSVRKGCGFLGSALAAPATAATGGRGSGREATRSSHLPKIIFPAVVCSTLVTEMSTVLPIILRALSTTTIVPSSR